MKWNFKLTVLELTVPDMHYKTYEPVRSECSSCLCLQKGRMWQYPNYLELGLGAKFC